MNRIHRFTKLARRNGEEQVRAIMIFRFFIILTENVVL